MQDLTQIPVFILAGGQGTRLSEETYLKPKPMIEIGNIPILLHIMRWYYSFGFNDFVICAGYRSWDIKDFFINYSTMHNHLTIDHRDLFSETPKHESHKDTQEKWRVRVVDTGIDAMTGARLARAYDHVSKTQKIENFVITYGDGLTDANLAKEIDFHISHGKIGTVLGVPPATRFGEMDIDAKNIVKKFVEKPESKKGLINGGFFVFNKKFRDFLSDKDDCILERQPLELLAQRSELVVYEHRGFWQCMDTLRDKYQLQAIWDRGEAPWFPVKSNLRKFNQDEKLPDHPLNS